MLRLRYLAPTALTMAIVYLIATVSPSSDATSPTSSSPSTPEASRSEADVGEINEVWVQIRDFMQLHKCTGAYLDVGSNIGVQIRKLYEPHKYAGKDPHMKALAARFGLLNEPTVAELEAGVVTGPAFWNTTSEVLPIFEHYFGGAPLWRVRHWRRAKSQAYAALE